MRRLAPLPRARQWRRIAAASGPEGGSGLAATAPLSLLLPPLAGSAEAPQARWRLLWAAAGTAAAAAALAGGGSSTGPRRPPASAAGARAAVVRCDATLASSLGQADGLLPVGVAQIDGNMPCEDRHDVLHLGRGLTAAVVLDGHGGWQVAEWLRGALLPTLSERFLLQTSPDDDDECVQRAVLLALEAAFAECEAALLRKVEASPSAAGLARALRIGACALCAVVGPTHLLVANAGDCQALLVRGGEPLPLSAIHNADQPEEQRRLRDTHPREPDVFVCKGSGATVLGGLHGLAQRAFGAQAQADMSAGLTACYVKGRLQPTRSFGDFYLKDARFANLGLLQPPVSPPYITAAPEIAVLPREPQDQVLILASDGLWDYLSGADAARVVRTRLLASPSEATASCLAQALVDEALRFVAEEQGIDEARVRSVPPGPRRRRLHDDITVVVVLL